MATTSKAMFRGNVMGSGDPANVIYTVPANTTGIVTNIILTNTNSSSLGVTLKLDGVPVLDMTSIAGNSIFTLDIKQVLAAGKTIEVYSSSANWVKIHVSGVEVTA